MTGREVEIETGEQRKIRFGEDAAYRAGAERVPRRPDESAEAAENQIGVRLLLHLTAELRADCQLHLARRQLNDRAVRDEISDEIFANRVRRDVRLNIEEQIGRLALVVLRERTEPHAVALPGDCARPWAVEAH